MAGLRASAGIDIDIDIDIDDSQLTELVGGLSVGSEDFRRMRARQDGGERTRGAKRYHTPLAEPGSEHEHALALLAHSTAPN